MNGAPQHPNRFRFASVIFALLLLLAGALTLLLGMIGLLGPLAWPFEQLARALGGARARTLIMVLCSLGAAALFGALANRLSRPRDTVVSGPNIGMFLGGALATFVAVHLGMQNN